MRSQCSLHVCPVSNVWNNWPFFTRFTKNSSVIIYHSTQRISHNTKLHQHQSENKKSYELIVASCFVEGPRSRCYGRTAALKTYCATFAEDDEDEVFSPFRFNGAPVEWNWQGKTEVIGEKLMISKGFRFSVGSTSTVLATRNTNTWRNCYFCYGECFLGNPVMRKRLFISNPLSALMIICRSSKHQLALSRRVLFLLQLTPQPLHSAPLSLCPHPLHWRLLLATTLS